MSDTDRDTLMRLSAFEHVRRLSEIRDYLTANDLKAGFLFDGARVPLINPGRGIFKPQRMRYLLSIRTVFPSVAGRSGTTISASFIARFSKATHITEDRDEQYGQPVFPNGIPLSKIHHAAFDKHLIGIDPDYQLHVSGRLPELKDGPMLEALKRLDGQKIHLPRRVKDGPDRDRLALRFERFKTAA